VLNATLFKIRFAIPRNNETQPGQLPRAQVYGAVWHRGITRGCDIRTIGARGGARSASVDQPVARVCARRLGARARHWSYSAFQADGHSRSRRRRRF